MVRYLNITDSDFSEIYSWVSFFTENYDNAEHEAQVLLHGIVQAYIEKKASERRYITEQEALTFLTRRNTNPRNAGRKPKFTTEQQSEMLLRLKSGMDKKEIAEQFHCSVSYVEKLRKRHGS